MANNSAAKKAAAAPAKPEKPADPSVDNATGTPDPAAPANTADQPTPGDGNDTTAEDREAQAEAAAGADVKVGPEPGTDEFAQQYKETLDQLAKTADPVEAPEGTPELTAYQAPEKTGK